MNVSNASSRFFHCFSGCISFCCTSPLSLWCYIWITRLFKNKWYGIPECLIAFSSLSITVINNVLLVGRLLRSDKTQVLVKYLASSLCKSHATWEIRKLLTLFKVHFFTNRSPHIFNIDFVFVVYFWTDSVKDSSSLIKSCDFYTITKCLLIFRLLLTSLYKHSLIFSTLTCFP